jgi:hypothetical protein
MIAAGLAGVALGDVFVFGLYLTPGGGVRPDSLVGAVTLGPLTLFVTRATDPLSLLPFVAVFYGVTSVLLLRTAPHRRTTVPAAVAYAMFPLGIIAFLAFETVRPLTGMTPLTMLSKTLGDETRTLRHLMTYHIAVFTGGLALILAWHSFAGWCLLRPWVRTR